MSDDPLHRCGVCSAALVAAPSHTSGNMDGTSGDATVTPFVCSGCGATATRWRIPRLAMEGGEVVCHWREDWIGGAKPSQG